MPQRNKRNKWSTIQDKRFSCCVDWQQKVLRYCHAKLDNRLPINWKTELTAGAKSIAEVKIQRGTFQRDALLPLVFVILIMPMNHILNKCTGRYKLYISRKKWLLTKKTYEFLGLLEAGTIKREEMKDTFF